MTEAMDQKSFEALLDEFGSNQSQWPTELRKEAEVLLESSEDARVSLSRASLLDEHLLSLAPHTATPGLAQRIIARAETTEDGWATLRNWLASSLWRPAAVLLAPLCLGMALGLSLPTETSQTDDYLSDYPWVEPEEVTFYE